MIEPSLAFRTAIRTRLINDINVTALVSASSILAGSTRPANFPCIMLADVQTQFLGYAAGSQYQARVFVDAHIWAIENGEDTAKSIGFAVMNALRDIPNPEAFAIDELQKSSVRWMKDPDPTKDYTHGVLSLEAVIRWKE
ncbi:DUF3168 domain-containing protein [Phyllobacterium zundukense]|uniref:DUF3168 domain-containing protein n=1 Tax=Phyllobacterium zundukense TaxID=1867719 RepID=A0A2N9W453_9HYPH|nr:DUF3168 domain-containing protein [Phyllobacterium zundukense]ATU92009.1 hypothetical protein BLM14_10480 [Phyllobacterium zundukense]PIO46521.1 hypothetical protein B5P45_01600 [Phyllobacterium zundukense]